jgi:hypothetical protein
LHQLKKQATKIVIPATTILGNEKAIALVETMEKGRRIQIIYVPRDGKQAEFRKDMGSVKKFKGVNLLNIPSLLEHTVDELIDLANELRGTSKIDVKDFLQIDKMKLN